MVQEMISLDLLIDLIGFCNCSKIYSWRGLRKHKFCWFGCLEERFNCTVCLLSLRPVYVWLCVSDGFMLVLFWFGLQNKFLLLLYTACCGLSFARMWRWVPATPITPLHHNIYLLKKVKDHFETQTHLLTLPIQKQTKKEKDISSE